MVSVTEIILNIYERCFQIATAPASHTEMIWALAPLVGALILIELYFDRYKEEDMGWNTAFSNNLLLIFISLDLVRVLYKRDMLDYATPENALVIAVVLLGFTLTVMTYFHIIPKELAYGVSSHLPMNIIAYLTVVIIYAGITIDFYTAIASVIIATIIGAILRIISLLIPESGEIPEIDDLEHDER